MVPAPRGDQPGGMTSVGSLILTTATDNSSPLPAHSVATGVLILLAVGLVALFVAVLI